MMKAARIAVRTCAGLSSREKLASTAFRTSAAGRAENVAPAANVWEVTAAEARAQRALQTLSIPESDVKIKRLFQRTRRNFSTISSEVTAAEARRLPEASQTLSTPENDVNVKHLSVAFWKGQVDIYRSERPQHSRRYKKLGACALPRD